MKITLLRPPTIIDAAASTGPICPPIGLAYLKSVSSRFSDDIHVLDSIGNLPEVRNVTDSQGHTFSLIGQDRTQISDALPSDSDIVLISCMFSQDWLYTKKIIRDVREQCPGSLIVAGGEHITALPEFSMNDSPDIDVCVSGEGETTLFSLLDEYTDHKTLPVDVPGVYSRTTRNQIRKGISRDRIRQLEQIPWPDWEGFPLENYWIGNHAFGVNLGGRSMPILASRGCPYRCTFCSSPSMWTTLWKARDPEDVLKEMKLYVSKYQVTNFDFYDLTVIIRRDWIVNFCNLLLESNLNVTWQLPSGTRSEAIDREVAHLLHKSGCMNLSYAPESGSPAILKSIKKKIAPVKVLASMQSAVAEGLSVKVNIMCGFPGESWKHLIETLWFIVKTAWVGCDDLSVNQFSPYPGSQLYDELLDAGKLQLDEKYFIRLSYYSSMVNAQSYSEHLSNTEIIVFKLLGTALFYSVAFARRPKRVWKTVSNISKGIETTRLEKTLISFQNRFRLPRPSN